MMEVWIAATQQWHSLLCQCTDIGSHFQPCTLRDGDTTDGHGVLLGQEGTGEPDDLDLLLSAADAADRKEGPGDTGKDNTRSSDTGIPRR